MLTASQMSGLAQDAMFRARVRMLVLQMCSQIFNESTGTALHSARIAFAFKLVQSPSSADQLADVLVSRTNVISSTVTYDFDRRAVVTDASDAAILSQLATDWNFLAGAQ